MNWSFSCSFPEAFTSEPHNQSLNQNKLWATMYRVWGKHCWCVWESGCEEMWRRMQYKRGWKRQKCCSPSGENVHLLQITVIGLSAVISRNLKSVSLHWECGLLSDCFQPVSHIHFHFISKHSDLWNTGLDCCTLKKTVVELRSVKTSWMLATWNFYGCSKCISIKTTSVLN